MKNANCRKVMQINCRYFERGELFLQPGNKYLHSHVSDSDRSLNTSLNIQLLEISEYSNFKSRKGVCVVLTITSFFSFVGLYEQKKSSSWLQTDDIVLTAGRSCQHCLPRWNLAEYKKVCKTFMSACQYWCFIKD